MLQASFKAPGEGAHLQRGIRSDEMVDGRLYKGTGDGQLYFKAYQGYIVQMSPDADGTGIKRIDTGFGGTFDQIEGDVVLSFNG